MNAREFAERALVGVLLTEPQRITDLDWLGADDFHSPRLGAIYHHMDAMVTHATTQVEWGYTDVPAPDEHFGVMSVPTPAEEAYQDVATTLTTVDTAQQHPNSRWTPQEVAEIRAHAADIVADNAGLYPGLLTRLNHDERTIADALLTDTSANAFRVSGVGPVELYERMVTSGELGDRFVTAPELHTLIATAPPRSIARPETYALMVLEASIRRRVEQGGIQVGQRIEQGADLGALLDSVDAALTDVEHAQHRWDSVTGQSTQRAHLRSVENTLAPDEQAAEHALPGADAEQGAAILPALIEAPDPAQVHQAEQSVIATVLCQPATLDALHEQLLPEDFADPASANTYRAALELHARGEHIDMVTVAWEQQRHERAHGTGLNPDQLLALANNGASPYHPSLDAEIVTRASLIRLTQSAADTVRTAAQHPGLQPNDLLHTTKMAYEAVRTTAERMGKGTLRLSRLAAPTPIGQALRKPTAHPSRTSRSAPNPAKAFERGR